MFHKQSPSSSRNPSPHHRHKFSETLMDDRIEIAQALISKWDVSPNSDSHYCNITNLFAADNRHEAKQYLNSIRELQTAMQYYISHEPTSENLALAQNLIQIAMKRLEREFYIILRSNRQHLDHESVSRASRSSVSQFGDESEEEEEESRAGEDSISEVELFSMSAMEDLKAISECMISAGYGKECIKIYKSIRKSIVDEALYHLDVDSRLSFAQIQKMAWEVLEVKIKTWLNAVKVAVKTLFYGERILCDLVFSSSPSMRESCFADITTEGALYLFVFPENVAKCKKAPERMFRTLDLYETIADLWPEIESIFDLESSSTVKQQAISSRIKLGEAARAILTDFESAISKDHSKAAVPGGDIHPMTRYVMNYVTFLTDYSGILAEILAYWPLPVLSSLPEAYFGSPLFDEGTVNSAISTRLAWLVLLMLCKLDGRAEMYKDAALSYLFLANNLQYVVNKVQKSSLKFLHGDEWIKKHEAKVRQYASNYERMGWSKVLATLPDINDNQMTAQQVTECFRSFNSSFEEAYNKQASWVVSDSKLRDQIKISVAGKLVPAYSEFYEKYRQVVARKGGIVRFTPVDLENYLSDLLFGTGGSSSHLSSSSSLSSLNSSPTHSRGGRSR